MNLESSVLKMMHCHFAIPSFCCLLWDKKVGRNVVLSSVQLMGALDLVLEPLWTKLGRSWNQCCCLPTGPPSVSDYPSPPPILQHVAQGETSSPQLLPHLGAGNVVASCIFTSKTYCSIIDELKVLHISYLLKKFCM